MVPHEPQEKGPLSQKEIGKMQENFPGASFTSFRAFAFERE